MEAQGPHFRGCGPGPVIFPRRGECTHPKAGIHCQLARDGDRHEFFPAHRQEPSCAMSREAGDGCMIVKLDLMQRICTSREDQGGEVS